MLKGFIYRKIVEAINNVSLELTDDIYAISCYIENINDDPRLCSMNLGFNTNKHYKDEIANASDANEAKWNFAFWPQNSLFSIGDTYKENSNSDLIEEWIKTNDLFYTDEEEEANFDEMMEVGEKIVDKFMYLVLQVVKRLHEDGVIINKFGKSIPVIVHELEYYEKIALQNIAVNPQNCIKDFEKWVRES